MKRFSVAVFLALVFAPPAVQAADMAVKAPPPPLDPAWSWTGLYIGLSAGGGWSQGRVDDPVVSTYCNPGVGGCPAFAPAVAALVTPSLGVMGSGGLGGAQIGYNFQSKNIVYGIEADGSWANIAGASSATTVGTVGASPVSFTTSVSERMKAFGTLRGRVGLTTPGNSLLVYVTGGLAVADISETTTLSNNVTNCACGFGSGTATASGVHAGGTIGAGAEYALGGRASLKLEYLYYDLGRMNGATTTLQELNTAGTLFYAVTTASSFSMQGNIVRGGVNYKF